MTDQVDPDRGRGRLGDRGVIWVSISLALAVAVSVLLLFVPLSTSLGAVDTHPSPRPGSSEGTQTRVTRHTLPEAEGWGVTGVLLIPVALCAAPLLIPRRIRRPVMVTATTLLGAGVIIGSASIGLFYLPTVITMAVAAFVGPPQGTPPEANTHT